MPTVKRTGLYVYIIENIAKNQGMGARVIGREGVKEALIC
jgi:hypothetical protein